MWSCVRMMVSSPIPESGVEVLERGSEAAAGEPAHSKTQKPTSQYIETLSMN